MKQQEIPGFKILMIRQVPMGSVLNAETADSYPLVECGTWISDNGHWMIQPTEKINICWQVTINLIGIMD